MRILMNVETERLNLYTRFTGEKFCSFKEYENAVDAVAVVIQGTSFQEDLEISLTFNIPVIVVAGSNNMAGQEYARKAAHLGVPDSCIVIKKEDKVCALDGREIAGAVRGIGVKAIVQAARYALDNKLYPELLVWEEEGEPVAAEEEPVVFDEQLSKSSSSKQCQNGVARLSKESDASLRVEGVLQTSRKVAVVLKATPDADSGKVAKNLAEDLNGLHFELSNTPESYKLYGKTIEKAVESGKYIVFTGNTFIGTGYISAEWLIVELDAAILTAIPDLVDTIYKKAEKMIHAVGEFKEGQSAVKTWLESGWKLDAIVPNKGFERFKEAFGKIVYPSAAALAAQFA